MTLGLYFTVKQRHKPSFHNLIKNVGASLPVLRWILLMLLLMGKSTTKKHLGCI